MPRHAPPRLPRPPCPQVNRRPPTAAAVPVVLGELLPRPTADRCPPAAPADGERRPARPRRHRGRDARCRRGLDAPKPRKRSRLLSWITGEYRRRSRLPAGRSSTPRRRAAARATSGARCCASSSRPKALAASRRPTPSIEYRNRRALRPGPRTRARRRHGAVARAAAVIGRRLAPGRRASQGQLTSAGRVDARLRALPPLTSPARPPVSFGVTARLPPPGPSFLREHEVRVGDRPLRRRHDRPTTTDRWLVAGGPVGRGRRGRRVLSATSRRPPGRRPIHRSPDSGPLLAGALSGLILEDAGARDPPVAPVAPAGRPSRPWRAARGQARGPLGARSGGGARRRTCWPTWWRSRVLARAGTPSTALRPPA